jgi:hypothetical protein
VTVQAKDLAKSLMDATQGAVIGNAQLKSNLLSLLNAAAQAYQQGQINSEKLHSAPTSSSFLPQVAAE